MDQTLGEIRLVAFPKVPVNWHICDGSLLSINDFQTLYSLIGTTYGGDGRTTFGLPDLRGRVPAGFGQGPNLPSYALGQKVGVEMLSLTQDNMPAHTHIMASNSTAGSGTLNSPYNAVPAVGPLNPSQVPVNTRFATTATSGSYMNPLMVYPAGASSLVPVIQPVLVLNYIIALTGLYPTRPS